jgi:hypothetical protein
VVIEINVCRFTASAIPPENKAPPVVDTDRMQASQSAPQLFEMIAGRDPQVLISCRVIDHLQLPKKAMFEVGRNVPRLDIVDEEGSQPMVPKAYDHAPASLWAIVPRNGTIF